MLPTGADPPSSAEKRNSTASRVKKFYGRIPRNGQMNQSTLCKLHKMMRKNLELIRQIFKKYLYIPGPIYAIILIEK